MLKCTIWPSRLFDYYLDLILISSTPSELPDDSLDPIEDRVGSPVVVGRLERDRVEHNTGHHLVKQ